MRVNDTTVAYQSGECPQFHQAIKIEPYFLDAVTYQGVMFNKTQKYDRAIFYYRQALELSQDNDNLFFNLGVAFAGLGRNNDAITFYKKAITMNPEHVTAINNLANVYFMKGDLAQSVLFFEKLLSLNPDFLEGHFNIYRDCTR